MKKILLLVGLLALLSVGAVALNGEVREFVFQKVSDLTSPTIPKAAVNIDQIQVSLASTDHKDDIIYDLTMFFAKNNLSDVEQRFLLSLINSGESIDTVKQVAMFWLDTDDDVSVVKGIIDILPDKEEMITIFDIETAFDKLTSNRGGLITYEQARISLDQGLTLEELHLANTLSRKGVYTIHEILNVGKADGKLNRAIKDIYSRTKRGRVNFGNISDQKFNDIEDYDEIMSAIKLSERSGEGVEKILSKPGKTAREMYDQWSQEAEAEIHKTLHQKGVTPNMIREVE